MAIHYCTRILIAAMAFAAFTSAADTLHGRVIGVSDGDTVTVLDTSNTKFKFG